MLTLFRPATGEVHAKGVRGAPNAVLHFWLKNELLQILAGLPEPAIDQTWLPVAADWATWLGHVPHLPLPPLSLILVWDNLAGHLSTSIVTWLFAHGVMPLYTPLSGSWLNMAESVQRIICGRALRGQHPTTVAEFNHLVGRQRRRLECNPNCVRVGWQAQRASPASQTALSR